MAEILRPGDGGNAPSRNLPDFSNSLRDTVVSKVAAASLAFVAACSNTPNSIGVDVGTDTEVDRRADADYDTGTDSGFTDTIQADTESETEGPSPIITEPIQPDLDREITIRDRVFVPPPGEIEVLPRVIVSPNVAGVYQAVESGNQVLAAYDICAVGSTVKLAGITLDTDIAADPSEIHDINLTVDGDLDRVVIMTRHGLSVAFEDSQEILAGDCIQIGLDMDLPTIQAVDIDFVATTLTDVAVVASPDEDADLIVEFLDRYGAERRNSPGLIVVFEEDDTLGLNISRVGTEVPREFGGFDITRFDVSAALNSRADIFDISLANLLESEDANLPVIIFWDYRDYWDNSYEGTYETTLGDAQVFSLEDLPAEVQDFANGDTLGVTMMATSIPANLVTAQGVLSIDTNATLDIYRDGEGFLVEGGLTEYPLDLIYIYEPDPVEAEVFFGVHDFADFGLWARDHYVSNIASGDHYANCDDSSTAEYELCNLFELSIMPENVDLNTLPGGTSLRMDSMSLDISSSGFRGQLSYTFESCSDTPEDGISRTGYLNTNGLTEISLDAIAQPGCRALLSIGSKEVQYLAPPVFPASLVHFDFESAEGGFVLDGLDITEPVPYRIWGPDLEDEFAETRYHPLDGYTTRPNFHHVNPEGDVGGVFSERIHVLLDELGADESITLMQTDIHMFYGDTVFYTITFKDPTGKLDRGADSPLTIANGHVLVLLEDEDNTTLRYMAPGGIRVRHDAYLNVQMIITNPDATYVTHDPDNPALNTPYEVSLVGLEVYGEVDADNLHSIPVLWGSREVSLTNPIPGNRVVIEGDPESTTP